MRDIIERNTAATKQVLWQNPPPFDPRNKLDLGGMVKGMGLIVEVLPSLIANPGCWALLCSWETKRMPNIYSSTTTRIKNLAKLDLDYDFDPERVEMTRRTRADDRDIVDFYIRYAAN
tara:strand:+ start:2727 stop:3080 length:354 start_codon:yes stop_codon:yes gene_type:complete